MSDFDLRVLSMLNEVASTLPPVSHARIAAAFFHKKRMISLGWNSYKTDPLQSKYAATPERIYLHAELSALKQALWTGIDLRKTTLYIARYSRAKGWGNSAPCVGCRRALHVFEVGKIIHTCDGVSAYRESGRVS